MTSKNATSRLAHLTTTSIFCASLAACGGGSGGGDTPAASAQLAALPMPVTAVVAATPTAPSSVSAVTPTQASVFSCGLNGAAGIQAEVLQRLNVLRAAGAVCGTNAFAATGAVTWNDRLLQAALGHSTDMSKNNYFAHTGLDGRTPDQRVTAAGYIWSNVGENIAAGQTSVEQVMNGWAKSPGHCQNLMNPNFRDVAVACVRNDAADYRLYWSMALGRSR